MSIASTDVVTGLDLKVLRVRRGVTQTALAQQMGIWRQTLSVLEGSLRPKPHQIERYLLALDELTDEPVGWSGSGVRERGTR